MWDTPGANAGSRQSTSIETQTPLTPCPSSYKQETDSDELMEPAIKKNPCEFPLQKKFTDRKMLSGGFWKQNADIFVGFWSFTDVHAKIKMKKFCTKHEMDEPGSRDAHDHG